MAFPLLAADAVSAISLGLGLLQPQWGIYLDGSPVIQPASVVGNALLGAIEPVRAVASLIGAPNVLPVTASTIEWAYSNDQPISTYPQEQGAFQSYDKVSSPAEIRIKLGCGGSSSTRQAFLSTCQSILNSLELFDVLTPERAYTSMNCVHMDLRRDARSGVSLLAVDLWFQEVRVTGQTDFSSTKSPADTAPTSIGAVQPTAIGSTGAITVRSLAGTVR